jgi:hypothetical protein
MFCLLVLGQSEAEIPQQAGLLVTGLGPITWAIVKYGHKVRFFLAKMHFFLMVLVMSGLRLPVPRASLQSVQISPLP